MTPLKKTLALFAGALALFFFFSFIDEWENLFPEKSAKKPVVIDSYEIEAILKKYLKYFSLSYLDASPGNLKELPLAEDLRQELEEEIHFLEKDGRIVDYQFKGQVIQNVVRAGPDKVRVSTKEVLAVNYLKAGDRSLIRSLPPALFSMSYVLNYEEGRWLISRYDVINIEAMEQRK